MMERFAAKHSAPKPAAGGVGQMLTGLLFGKRARGTEERFLAVGGIHIFEEATPCQLIRAVPEGAVRDLNWVDTLALEAIGEGEAELLCGAAKLIVKIAVPDRMEIAIVSKVMPAEATIDERLQVQAKLHDNLGRELEVGKFTHFQWSASGALEIANDRSSGEFGFCDTCYGMQSFRATKAGSGTITVSFKSLHTNLTVTVKS